MKNTNEKLIKQIKSSLNPDEIESLKMELINQNNGFISKLAHRYRYKMEFEDAYQSAVEGFLVAINGFDYSKNVLLLTYATLIVKKSIQNNNPDYDYRRYVVINETNLNPNANEFDLLKIIRKKYTDKKFISLERIQTEMNFKTTPIEDWNAGSVFNEGIKQIEARDFEEKILEKLTEEERKLYLLLKAETKNNEIAKIFGFTKTITHKKKAKLFEKIRNVSKYL